MYHCMCMFVRASSWQPDVAPFGLWRSWEESLPIVVKGLFISTCYRPPSVGLLYNNGTGKAGECKVIDVGLYLALLQTGTWKEVAIPPFHSGYPASKGQSADQDFLRDLISTKCQSAQKTSWPEHINTVSWVINQIANRRDRMNLFMPHNWTKLHPVLITRFLVTSTRYRLFTNAFFPFYWWALWPRR